MHCNIHREPVELDERHNFPMLDDDKVYLDSSSTSFTPRVVIDSVNEYFNKYQANYNRGFNDLVTAISSKIDNVRKKVAEFIGAKQEEIIFTAGASFSSKMITNEIAIRELKTDDEVLLCRLDHSSTVTPWLELQELLKNFNVDIKIQDILIDLWGDYNEEDLTSKVNDKTKYVVLTHIHNVYGLEMGIKQLTKDIRAKNPNVKIVLDASQSISHIDVNVVDLDVDYLYFSGHKMFAPTGIGVLYARGKSCKDFEDGTLNILGIIGLGSAIDYIESIGVDKIENYLFYLTRYLYNELLTIDGIEFNKGIDKCKCEIGYGIISFKHSRVSTEEINELLNYYKIYVRSSSFCQKGQDEYIRISLNPYNTKRDIDKFIKVVKAVVEGQ